MIETLRGFVVFVVGSYAGVLFLRIILSWFPITPPDALRPAFNFLYDVTEPVLQRVRRLMPALPLGGMSLDLSPILAFIIVRLLVEVIIRVPLPG